MTVDVLAAGLRSKANNNNATQQFLQQIIASAHHQLIQAIDSVIMSSANHCFLRGRLPLLILARLREKQLALWRKRKPDLLRESMTLTPIRKYLITRRCQRDCRELE